MTYETPETWLGAWRREGYPVDAPKRRAYYVHLAECRAGLYGKNARLAAKALMFGRPRGFDQPFDGRHSFRGAKS